jgi:hypothetical protein
MILFGIVLFVVGYQWNRLRPPAAYWSDEQAAELTAAQVELHELSHSRLIRSDPSLSPQFTAARERLKRINNLLEGARRSRSRTGTFFMVTGLTAIFAAVIIHFRHSRVSSG